MDIHVDVVDLDEALIIGLDILNSQGLLVNYIDNSLHFCEENIRRPLTYKFGHVFFEWDRKETFFTREELTRLHLHFMHPSSRRLFDLIARSDPTKATPSIRKLIESISEACSTCQSFKSAPLRFNASMPKDNVVFNHTISIYLVWLDERPAVHVIDEQTRFWSAAFLKSKAANDIWNAFVACWVSTYIGFPSKIRSDQESAVTSDKFRQLSNAHGITLEFSGLLLTIQWDKSKSHTDLCAEFTG